jgi:mannose-6-phosphate isomerase-like protein (cupin superfamily)
VWVVIAGQVTPLLCPGGKMIIKHNTIKPIDFEKLEIVDFTAGQNNSSSFAEITIPAGISHKLSWSNRSDKYYYVVQGKINFTLEDDSYELFAGDVCIVPKGKQFRYKNIGDTEAKLILVHTPSFKIEYEGFEE